MPTVSLTSKQAEQMTRIMTQENLSYNAEGKQAFKRASVSALRRLAKDLGLTESKAYFNAGGIAVSGDAILMGMWKDENGIYIMVNQSMGNKVLFRSIRHMKDYTGGSNQYLPLALMVSDYAAAVETFLSLKH